MKQKKKQQLKREVKNFTATGLIATAIDYGVLNILTLLFHVSPVPANIVSTTVSSIAGYILNHKVVFEGRRYGLKRTILFYIVITAVGIYVIQSLILYLLGNKLEGVGQALSEALGGTISAHAISLNLAKAFASLVAGLWNYFMLRQFVFIPESKKNEIEAA